jgi:hypothetical protein
MAGRRKPPAPQPQNARRLKRALLRALVEAGFIIFLFYSNLLMGEFSRSGAAQGRGFWFALADIFTAANFLIAVVTSLIGYALIELLRSLL